MDYLTIRDAAYQHYGVQTIRTATVGGSGTLAFDTPKGPGFPEALTNINVDKILLFVDVKTPYGNVPMVKLFKVGSYPVVRIPMHGWRLPVANLDHTLATFWLLYKLGVEQVITEASVGGIRAKPLDVVIPDDVYIHEPAKVAMAQLAIMLDLDPWVRMNQPFCPRLRSELSTSVLQVKEEGYQLGELIKGGVYWTMPLGPFETAFEITVIKTHGSTVVGQSSGQEAMAARLLGMCFAVVNPVVNYAEGLEGATWSGSEGMDNMYQQIATPMALTVYKTLERIVKQQRSPECEAIAKSPHLIGPLLSSSL